MLSKIKTIETKFKTLKNVGGDGEALAKLTERTIENMMTIVESFELGLNSSVWRGNLEMTLSEEEQIAIFSVYRVFKETLEKLNEPEV